jgi:hypothetical protein
LRGSERGLFEGYHFVCELSGSRGDFVDQHKWSNLWGHSPTQRAAICLVPEQLHLAYSGPTKHVTAYEDPACLSIWGVAASDRYKIRKLGHSAHLAMIDVSGVLEKTNIIHVLDVSVCVRVSCNECPQLTIADSHCLLVADRKPRCCCS